MYYVYLHQNKKTKEIMYCGKGSGYRYCGWNSRSVEHAAMLKRGEIEYIILKEFADERKAYDYEERVTDFFKRVNQCKFNINSGRRLSNETKAKISKTLKGTKRSKETKERIKRNHSRVLAKAVMIYKDDTFIRRFRSSREAGNYAVENGICSYGWVGRSLKTGEKTKLTKKFPTEGYRFVYEDARMNIIKPTN